VPPDVLEAHRAADPVVRLRRYLISAGLTDEPGERDLLARLRAEVDAAVDEVEALPSPGLDGVFEHAYVDPPPRLQRQRHELEGR
jgi:TPP-dependent pyruvate/acetoin dehydrogenase alpha subunit